MYRAIIIDDEEAVRTGLRSHFDWERHGVSVAAEFPDCEKAYRYIREHPVELVVTDVVTPHMDGITLAKKLRSEFPAVQIVFISGHADVQFLREAMKSSAIDYILKSVDMDELSAAISRVVERLDKQGREKRRVQAMEEQIRRLAPLHRERTLRALLDGEDDSVCRSYLGLNLDTSAKYVCMVIRLANKWNVARNLSGPERLARSLECERVCSRAVEGKSGSLTFKNRNSEFIIILKCAATDYEQDMLDVSRCVQEGFLEQTGFETVIGLSEPADLSAFSGAYQEACEALEHCYYLAEDTAIAVKKYPELQSLKAAREYAEKQLPEAILSGQPDQVEAVLGHTFAYVRSMPEQDQDNFMLSLLLLPPRTMPGLRTREDSPYRNQRGLVEHWLGCLSHVEQERFLLQVMAEVTRLLGEDQDPGTSALIGQIKRLIDQQYMDQISVTSLAGQVHLTPTYLCVLFKQSTGLTINEYLTAERIRHAKELLRQPDVRLYDICYRVGYLSPSYFSKLFKKQTGMPPSEYRFNAFRESGQQEGA